MSEDNRIPPSSSFDPLEFDNNLHCICDCCGKVSMRGSESKRFCDDYCRAKWHRLENARKRKLEKAMLRGGAKVLSVPVAVRRPIAPVIETSASDEDASPYDDVNLNDILRMGNEDDGM
jgi:hypothetical protein